MTSTSPTPQQLLEAKLLADSPLKEIDRDSLNELFRRVNDHLILGLPEEVLDEDLDEMSGIFRARRSSFLIEEEKKLQQGPKKRQKKTPNLDLLDNL